VNERRAVREPKQYFNKFNEVSLGGLRALARELQLVNPNELVSHSLTVFNFIFPSPPLGNEKTH
jgi:hypothetical protein